MRYVRTLSVLVGIVAVVLLTAGCAVRHLHPKAGKAFNAIWAKQAQRPGGKAEQLRMVGEEVEIVMKNHNKRATVSEVKNAGSTPSIGILPLQR